MSPVYCIGVTILPVSRDKWPPSEREKLEEGEETRREEEIVHRWKLGEEQRNGNTTPRGTTA